MLNIKNARVRSENDVKLLKNRLERLRQEELKALKKIEETKRRADQIISLKHRNHDLAIRKDMERDIRQEYLSREKDRLSYLKNERVENVRQTQEIIFNQKRSEAQTLKSIRKENETVIAQQREAILLRNKQSKEVIKGHQNEVMHRKMQQRMVHEELLQQEMEERLSYEDELRQQADGYAQSMETQEELLIERLRRTQEAQKMAYEELERALSNPPKAVASSVHGNGSQTDRYS